MTPMEKLMNGAGPIIVIFVVFLAAIGIYKFFQKRGSVVFHVKHRTP